VAPERIREPVGVQIGGSPGELAAVRSRQHELRPSTKAPRTAQRSYPRAVPTSGNPIPARVRPQAGWATTVIPRNTG